MRSSEQATVGDLSVADLLSSSTLPTLEARALLAHQLGVAREQLIAQPERRVARADAQNFAQFVAHRQRGEPLAYLLGEKEFYGRMFAVSPAVLIPRPETELLVEAALSFGLRDDARVLDLGTGSGCIALTLALERPAWHVTATDSSKEAIRIARANAEKWQATNLTFRHASWFAAVPDRFDLIVSNPPYVAVDDPHLGALRFEPRAALIADAEGLASLHAIIDGAPPHLVPGGYLALEHGYDQAASVRNRLAANSWRDVRTLTDLAGLERVTLGRTSAV